MQSKILRPIFVSLFVLAALTMLLSAGTSNDALNSSKVPLVPPHATFTTFDVPGTLESVNGINPAGAITGWYADTSGLFHGFVRAPEGTVTTFDPRAPLLPLSGQVVCLLPARPSTPAGVITGYYSDASRRISRLPAGSRWHLYDIRRSRCRQWDRLCLLYYAGGRRRRNIG
jgi:hypothetical protein